MDADGQTSRDRASIARIAERCRVSAMTVSRALRGQGVIAAHTRRRILAVAEEIGYQPNVRRGRPRRPSRKTRPSVDVILSTAYSSVSMFYAQLLVTTEQELARRGHDCLIRTCSGEYEDFLSICETLRAAKTSGTLAVGHFTEDQLCTLLEIVPDALLLDHPGDIGVGKAYECIGFDNMLGARFAVEHLIEQGRSRIALLLGPGEHTFSREVLRGYQQTLAEAGLKHDTELLWEADFTSEGGRTAVRNAIQRELEFDAVFTNDEMAVGTIRALHECRRRVPEDVAVVGYDGLPVGLQTIPRLTTVVLDYDRMGRVAVGRLMARSESGGPEFRVRLLPRLEIRESSTVLEL
jgi:DNA-binding LacI/PurR family transcriptional regulator